MIAGYSILFISVMTNKKWILLLLFIAGLIILLLPDQGKPVIVLNKKHGPSLQDLIGLLLMLISWLVSCIVVIRGWEVVKLKTGNSNFRLLIVIYIVSIIGITLCLKLSFDLILWFCIAVGSFVNILFIIYAFDKR
jgi:hypothetical protein